MLGEEPRPGLRTWTTHHDEWENAHATLSAALAPLLDLPVELVLTAHGESVLGDAPAALG